MTEAEGDNAVPPRLLTAYGAVSQWAHEHQQVLTGPPWRSTWRPGGSGWAGWRGRRGRHTRTRAVTAHPAVLIGVLCGVQFLAVVDSLAVALALPAIGTDLGLSPAGLSWVMNAMSVALAGGLLVRAGWATSTEGGRCSSPGSCC